MDMISRRWNRAKSRDEFVARLSADIATRLYLASRTKHSLGVCQECEKYSNWVESFPCKGKGMDKYVPGGVASFPAADNQTTPTSEAAAALNVCDTGRVQQKRTFG